MNIQGWGPGFEVRTLQVRRVFVKQPPPPAPSDPSISQPPLDKHTAQLPAVLIGFKGGVSAKQEANSSSGAKESCSETAAEDSNAPEQPDQVEDFTPDWDVAGERDAETDLADEAPEQEAAKRGNPLAFLEARCYSRLLLVEQLINRLDKTHCLLRLLLKGQSRDESAPSL